MVLDSERRIRRNQRHAIFGSKPFGTRDIGGVPGRSYAAGAAINDQDEIVGFDGADASTAFYWSRSTGIIILPTLGGAKVGAFWINAGSAITGSITTSTGATHAAFWPDKNSTPQDLGTRPGGAKSYARNLDNSGSWPATATPPSLRKSYVR